MKIDGLGILLIIIVFPIVLIVSYYIQMQVSTVATENNYNTKLLDSTYDALSAFEINTANEDLSNVSDSMRSIIEASNNTFLNTLATNLGMSNASHELLQPYVPAVLYTLYDGYYIYTPTEVPVVYEKTSTDGELITSSKYHYIGDDCEFSTNHANDGHKNISGNYGDIIYVAKTGGYTTDKSEAQTQKDYILKPYTQYSAHYKHGSTIDVTINYTLDNYLNIEGTIGEIYYTKTGYLIKNNLVSEIKINGVTYDKTTINEDDIKDKILGNKTNVESTSVAAATTASVTLDGKTISASWNTIIVNIQHCEDSIFDDDGDGNRDKEPYSTTVTTISEVEELLDNGKIDDNNVIYEVQKYKAIAYYASSACFSSWVYTNLSDLEYKDIQDSGIKSNFTNYVTSNGSDNFYYDFSENETKIFDSSQNPESSKSNFNTHKMEVIKNSIKFNLNLVISNYANTMNTSYNFSLPIIEDDEWDKILSNISIVSFMQGWNCVLDIYNNYAIATSTNNELMVTDDEIYYVPKSQFNDENSYYHRINCGSLAEDELISFTSKEIKYDKIYNKNTGKYEYDHKNLACYSCINTGNYSKNSLSNKLKTARYIGIGCQKQGVYKMNALAKSEGYVYNYVQDYYPHLITSKALHEFDVTAFTSYDDDKVNTIEVTISNTSRAIDKSSDKPVESISLNGGKFRITNSQTNIQTITINKNNFVEKLTVDDYSSYESFNYEVVGVKYIYN